MRTDQALPSLQPCDPDWAFAIPILPSELVSSWLCRSAHLHGIGPYSFLSLRLPGEPLWDRDIDVAATDGVVRRLARLSGQPTERIHAATLRTHWVPTLRLAGGWALTHNWLMVAIFAVPKALIWSSNFTDEAIVGHLRQAFPCTEDLSAVFIENTEARRPAIADPLAGLHDGHALRCQSIARADFGRVLAAFGLGRALEPSLLSDLHAISGGHLAKQIMKVETGTDLATLLAKGDQETLMSELLDKRLSGMGSAAELSELLSIAARAGSAFSEAELRCAFADPLAFPGDPRSDRWIEACA